MNPEPIFVAANNREADDVERLLDAAGVEYASRLDVITREDYNGPCYEGTLYEVDAARAEECRRLLRRSGLTKGLVSAKG
jgi:hypothetical protein